MYLKITFGFFSATSNNNNNKHPNHCLQTHTRRFLINGGTKTAPQYKMETGKPKPRVKTPLLDWVLLLGLIDWGEEGGGG
jgi:hypothetical protein